MPIATLDRSPQRQTLDIDAGLRDVAQVGRRYRADAKAALVGGLHQPVGDEPRQRFAHGGKTDGKLLGEAGDMQLLAGQQPGRQDVRPQPFLNGRRQTSWPVLGQIIPKTQPDTAHRAADWRLEWLSSIENRFLAVSSCIGPGASKSGCADVGHSGIPSGFARTTALTPSTVATTTSNIVFFEFT